MSSSLRATGWRPSAADWGGGTVVLRRRSNCPLSRAMDGCIPRRGTTSSCQSAATSNIVKCCCSRVFSCKQRYIKYPDQRPRTNDNILTRRNYKGKERVQKRCRAGDQVNQVSRKSQWRRENSSVEESRRWTVLHFSSVPTKARVKKNVFHKPSLYMIELLSEWLKKIRHNTRVWQTDRQTDRHGFNTMKHTHKKTEKKKLKLKRMKEKIPRLHHRKSSTVWVKKSPLRFSDNFFPNGWVFLINFFTHLLYVPFYTRWQIVTQLFPTLTKLCHTKRDHAANFYISIER